MRNPEEAERDRRKREDILAEAEDIALGYKQLAAVERVFRDLRHRVDIRPVYHRLADRIRAHVLLCWLGLLLIRVAENETGETWCNLRRTLGSLKVGIHGTPSGEVRQTSPPIADQTRAFKTLGVAPPLKARLAKGVSDRVGRGRRLTQPRA